MSKDLGDFDLNALFSKVVDRDSASKKKADKKKEEEAKAAQINLDTSVDSIQMYQKISKKLIKDDGLGKEKEVVLERR